MPVARKCVAAELDPEAGLDGAPSHHAVRVDRVQGVVSEPRRSCRGLKVWSSAPSPAGYPGGLPRSLATARRVNDAHLCVSLFPQLLASACSRLRTSET